eukprot:scaffold2022_cov387-Prasinococcus_capsulatus_cf.AAC.6
MHHTKCREQFQSYVNRFGPGLVIYWFGYVRDLDDDAHVLLAADFPSLSQIVQLPQAAPNVAE